MKSKSKVWSRAVAVLVAGMLVGTKACADSPCSPRVLLNKGDDGVLTPPEASFSHEIRRIKIAAGGFTAKPPPSSHARSELRSQRTAEAELDDLRAALRRLKTPKAELERIVAAHAAERANLSGNGANQAQVAAGLPPEFADYFRGSIALRKGDSASAIREWETLLKRPAAERHFKSVWAAYMLGRAQQEEEPDRAIEYFQQARSLAAEGYADSTGLAAASIGWEARAHLCQRRLAKAIELYLEQAAAGDDSAITSLRIPASDALAQPALLSDLVTHPQGRRVITAYANAENPAVEGVVHWLELVGRQDDLDADEPETLALAAYRSGEYETTQRWIKRSRSTPVTQWLQAKICVQAGKLNQAVTLLSKAAAALPLQTGPETNEPPHDTLAQNIFVWGRWSSQIVPAQHIMAELGVLRLTRRDYAGALNCFLRAGFWMDAAYVAERVLTVEELKACVDRDWPDADLSKSPPENTPEVGRWHIRHLLARRLVRASLPARSYFPDELRARYDALMAALKRGETESVPAEERAAGWWEGAKLIREHGMDLIGTELEPDWRSGWPNYSLTVFSRATNDNAKVLIASADELRRARDHRADPEERHHYRYQAAFIALQAASLLPDNSGQKARILCTAGSWIKYLHPVTADIFYKHLVRRCRKTPLGAAADIKRWFPTLDDNGE